MIFFTKINKFIIINLYIFFILISHALYAEENSDKQATISVSGSHSVLVEYDEVRISGSIETYHLQAQKAVQDNADIVKKVRDALEKAGMDPKKLISHNYSLRSNYDYNEGQKIFRNYQVTHDIVLSTKELKKIGIIADLLANAGVNHISNINFTSSKAKQAYDEALKNAVSDARNKALRAVSGIDNLAIGKAISVHIDQSSHNVRPVMYDVAEASGTMLAKSSTPTELHTEGQTIDVTVQTIWEIINN